jgi:hypothetical protein
MVFTTMQTPPPLHQQVIFFNHIPLDSEVDKAKANGATPEEIQFIANQELAKMNASQNWFYDYSVLNSYKNTTPFIIKPQENIIVLPKSDSFSNEFSYEIKYCLDKNEMQILNQEVYHLCIWITNTDTKVELYVEEGTSLAALMEQTEINYGLCHIPLKSLEDYFLYYALNNITTPPLPADDDFQPPIDEQTIDDDISHSNSSSSSSSSSCTNSNSSSSNSSNDIHIEDIGNENVMFENSGGQNKFDKQAIAHACVNAANATAATAAAIASIVAMLPSNN